MRATLLRRATTEWAVVLLVLVLLVLVLVLLLFVLLLTRVLAEGIPDLVRGWRFTPDVEAYLARRAGDDAGVWWTAPQRGTGVVHGKQPRQDNNPLAKYLLLHMLRSPSSPM